MSFYLISIWQCLIKKKNKSIFNQTYVFSSPELKVFFRRLSLLVRPSVNFSHFNVFSRDTEPITIKLSTNHSEVEGVKSVKMNFFQGWRVNQKLDICYDLKIWAWNLVQGHCTLLSLNAVYVRVYMLR